MTERERRLRETGLATGSLFFGVHGAESGSKGMVLHLQPNVAAESSGAAAWTLRLLEEGEPRLVVPATALLHVCMDFTVGHHRQQAEVTRCTKARYHFCLVLADKRPPVPLWTPTDAERQAVVGVLRSVTSGQPVPPISVLRLGMLDTRAGTGHFRSEACLVALVPGRLLVFSGECVPLFILRPTGVAQLPQQRRALGFEVRHAMGATEFVAADAEMKNVWFEAISATCDGWAAGVGDLPPRMPSRTTSRGSDLSEVSSLASTSVVQLGARLAPSLSRLPGFRTCAASKEAMLRALEQDHLTQRILRRELETAEAGLGAVRMRQASRLALVAKLHASGSAADVAALPLVLQPAGSEGLSSAAAARREARLSARLTAQRNALAALLEQCVDREGKVERLARTVALLPDESISSRRYAGMSPIEASIRSGSRFFNVRFPSAPLSAAPSILILDAEEGALHVKTGETVVQSFDLADVAPLCLGYRAGHFRCTGVPDSCCFGIVCLSGGMPFTLHTDTEDEREGIHRALYLGGESPPLMPPPLLHAGELCATRSSAPIALGTWSVLLPDRLLLLAHADSAAPLVALSLLGASIKYKTDSKARTFTLTTLHVGSLTLSCPDAACCLRWVDALGALVPVVHSGSNSASPVSIGRGSPPLTPAVLQELSRQHESFTVQIQLLRQEISLAEMQLLQAHLSAQRLVAMALAHLYAHARPGLFRSRSRLSFSPGDMGKGGTGVLAGSSGNLPVASPPGVTRAVSLPAPTAEQLLERATWINAEVRSEMVLREAEIRQLQQAAVAFSSSDWEWGTLLSDGKTLWDVWHRADERARTKRLSEVWASQQGTEASKAKAVGEKLQTQKEEEEEDQDSEEGTTVLSAPRPSFWSSLRSLGSGLPIGISDDTGVDADASRHEARITQKEDWLISFANRLLEM